MCINHTPLTTRCVPSVDPEGRDVLVIVGKLTCASLPDSPLFVAARQRPIRVSDGQRTAAPWSSIRFAAETMDEKPGTDVLLVGTLQPHERARSVDVSLRVGPLHRTLRVFGPRVWHASPLGVTPGPAADLVPTALIWENTFGGVDHTDPARPRVDWRNPAGKGHARDRKRLIEEPAPVLEDPHAPGEPAAFAPIAPSWEPRRSWAGTHDEMWRRTRAPVRPGDFDPRHHCCAPPGQWLETPLGGGEHVEVAGPWPEPWRFRLPHEAPSFSVALDDGWRALDTHLDTVLLDIDAKQVELTWRARIALPRKWERVRAIAVHVAEPDSTTPRRLPTLR